MNFAAEIVVRKHGSSYVAGFKANKMKTSQLNLASRGTDINVTGMISHIIYRGRHYANNEAGLRLLSEAMIDRATTESRLGSFTLVCTDGTRNRIRVVNLFTPEEIGL